MESGSFFHGDPKRNHHFWVYEDYKHVENMKWDFYFNPCDNSIQLSDKHPASY